MDPTERLEELRAELRAERISYGELAELADLAPYIAPGDVELLEAAGVPEHADDIADGDLWTEDGNTFWEQGGGHCHPDRPAIALDPERYDDRDLEAYFQRHAFWPSVWFVSDHGNVHAYTLR
jgi:hypothetical protein